MKTTVKQVKARIVFMHKLGMEAREIKKKNNNEDNYNSLEKKRSIQRSMDWFDNNLRKVQVEFWHNNEKFKTDAHEIEGVYFKWIGELSAKRGYSRIKEL